MGGLAGSLRASGGIAAGLAAALSVAGATASAQPAPTAMSAAMGTCPAAADARQSPYALTACFYGASIRASRAARHDIMFETGKDASRDTAVAFAAAATATSDDLMAMAGRSAGRSALARISTVSVTLGAAPGASLSDGVLTVTIAPALGAAGLPSPDQVERAAEAR